MMQRDEEIAARYKKGKARAIGAIAQGLINKARGGDTTSMIFFLKTQAGWRETSKIEHTVPEAPRSLDLTVLSDEALEEMLAVVNKAIVIEATATGVLDLEAERFNAIS